MNLLPLILVILIAPLVYFAVGYPFAVRLGLPRLACVIGLAVTGWVCESIIIARLPVLLPLSLLGVVSAFGWFRTETAAAGGHLRECYLVYTWPLAAAILTPFPGMGVWSTDWLYNYQTGLGVLGRLPYGGPMLERPPLGGASCIPLWMIAEGFPTFQVWSAVTSTALVLVARELYRELGGTRQGARVWLPLLASSFFLHHTMLCWAKFMAAGLTLSGLLLMHRATRELSTRQWIGGSVLFAFAVATHQSAILYVPFLVLFAARNAPLRATAIRLGIALAAGLIIVLPFELWTIATFGLDAKVNANPAVAQRAPNATAAALVTWMLISTVVPWNFVDDTIWCIHEQASWSSLYWLATGVLTALAGTFVGSALPFLPLRSARGSDRSWLAPLTSWGFLACVALALLGNAVLSPFAAKWGSAQTGVVPIQLLLYVVLIRWLDGAGRETERRVNRLALMLGIVPYALLAGAVTTWLRADPGAPETFLTWEDHDYRSLFAYVDGASLAFVLYPLGPALVIGLCLLPFVVAPGRKNRLENPL